MRRRTGLFRRMQSSRRRTAEAEDAVKDTGADTAE